MTLNFVLNSLFKHPTNFTVKKFSSQNVNRNISAADKRKRGVYPSFFAQQELMPLEDFNFAGESKKLEWESPFFKIGFSLNELQKDTCCDWKRLYKGANIPQEKKYIFKPHLRMWECFVVHNGQSVRKLGLEKIDMEMNYLMSLAKVGVDSKNYFETWSTTPYIPFIIPYDEVPVKLIQYPYSMEKAVLDFSDDDFFNAIGLNPLLISYINSQPRPSITLTNENEIDRFFQAVIIPRLSDCKDDDMKNSREHLVTLRMLMRELYSGLKVYTIGEGVCNPVPMFIAGRSALGNITGLFTTTTKYPEGDDS